MDPPRRRGTKFSRTSGSGPTAYSRGEETDLLFRQEIRGAARDDEGRSGGQRGPGEIQAICARSRAFHRLRARLGRPAEIDAAVAARITAAGANGSRGGVPAPRLGNVRSEERGRGRGARRVLGEDGGAEKTRRPAERE